MFKIFSDARAYNIKMDRLVNSTLRRGDRVRLAVDRKTFDKEGEVWSREIFTVKGRSPSGFTFALTDDDGHDVARRYMARDLQIVSAGASILRKISDDAVIVMKSAHKQTNGGRSDDFSEPFVPFNEIAKTRERTKEKVSYLAVDLGRAP